MRSERQREASRINGRASRGPKTAAGKARSSQNARRHGLTISAREDPAFAAQILALAEAIAGQDRNPLHPALAMRVAVAQIDVMRARRALWELLLELERDMRKVARLPALDRYERRAAARRKLAMRELDDVRAAAALDAQHFAKTSPAKAAGAKNCQNEPAPRRTVELVKRTRGVPADKIDKTNPRKHHHQAERAVARSSTGVAAEAAVAVSRPPSYRICATSARRSVVLALARAPPPGTAGQPRHDWRSGCMASLESAFLACESFSRTPPMLLLQAEL